MPPSGGARDDSDDVAKAAAAARSHIAQAVAARAAPDAKPGKLARRRSLPRFSLPSFSTASEAVAAPTTATGRPPPKTPIAASASESESPARLRDALKHATESPYLDPEQRTDSHPPSLPYPTHAGRSRGGSVYARHNIEKAAKEAARKPKPPLPPRPVNANATKRQNGPADPSPVHSQPVESPPTAAAAPHGNEEAAPEITSAAYGVAESGDREELQAHLQDWLAQGASRRFRVSMREDRGSAAAYVVQTRGTHGLVFASTRHFKEFSKLRESMLKQFPGAVMACLPPPPHALARASHSKEAQEKRIRGLELFLQSVLGHPFLSRDAEVMRFVGASSVEVASMQPPGGRTPADWWQVALELEDTVPSPVEVATAALAETTCIIDALAKLRRALAGHGEFLRSSSEAHAKLAGAWTDWENAERRSVEHLRGEEQSVAENQDMVRSLVAVVQSTAQMNRAHAALVQTSALRVEALDEDVESEMSFVKGLHASIVLCKQHLERYEAALTYANNLVSPSSANLAATSHSSAMTSGGSSTGSGRARRFWDDNNLEDGGGIASLPGTPLSSSSSPAAAEHSSAIIAKNHAGAGGLRSPTAMLQGIVSPNAIRRSFHRAGFNAATLVATAGGGLRSRSAAADEARARARAVAESEASLAMQFVKGTLGLEFSRFREDRATDAIQLCTAFARLQADFGNALTRTYILSSRGRGALDAVVERAQHFTPLRSGSVQLSGAIQSLSQPGASPPGRRSLHSLYSGGFVPGWTNTPVEMPPQSPSSSSQTSSPARPRSDDSVAGQKGGGASREEPHAGNASKARSADWMLTPRTKALPHHANLVVRPLSGLDASISSPPQSPSKQRNAHLSSSSRGAVIGGAAAAVAAAAAAGTGTGVARSVAATKAGQHMESPSLQGVLLLRVRRVPQDPIMPPVGIRLAVLNHRRNHVLSSFLWHGTGCLAIVFS